MCPSSLCTQSHGKSAAARPGNDRGRDQHRHTREAQAPGKHLCAAHSHPPRPGTCTPTTHPHAAYQDGTAVGHHVLHRDPPSPLGSMRVRPHQLLYHSLHLHHLSKLCQTVLEQPPPDWNLSDTLSSSCTKLSSVSYSPSSSSSTLAFPFPLQLAPFLPPLSSLPLLLASVPPPPPDSHCPPSLPPPPPPPAPDPALPRWELARIEEPQQHHHVVKVCAGKITVVFVSTCCDTHLLPINVSYHSVNTVLRSDPRCRR
jgi:hypothetical protein